MILCALLATLVALANDPSEEPGREVPEAAAPREHPVVAAAPGRGMTVTSADDRFSMSVRGRIQLRHSVLGAPIDEALDWTQATQVRTARVYLVGHTLSRDVGYVLQLAVAPNDYRDGTISPVFDAYLDWQISERVAMRVGQFFVPFDRARTNREWALQLPERPRAVMELTLDRDTGVVLYSDTMLGDDSPIVWRLGVFSGGGPNALGVRRPGGLGVARLELHPFGRMKDSDVEGDQEIRSTPSLALGVGAAYNHASPKVRSTTGNLWTTGTSDNLHLVADGVLKWRGLGLMGEVLRREVLDHDLTDPEGPRPAWGWLTQASVAFNPQVEIVGRWGRTLPGEGADPTWAAEIEARSWEAGAGANHYFNGHRFKLQAGWQALYEEDIADAHHGLQAQIDVTF